MGELFGNYELVRKLATGGMAEVMLAKQRSLGGFERLVCLKRILPHLAEQEDFLSMFLDEARIAANLTHPNIAQIYDISQVEGQYFIAMEYVRGEDIRRVYNQEVSRGTTIPPARAALIVMGAAAGLDYAHRQTDLHGAPLGIVHRDISPQNIVITYDGFPKVIDFGVAKAQGKLGQTRAGVLKGKYSYMSPEQALGDPVDARTDIFALGITLFEITTGTRLFKRENELETLHAVIACNIPSPRHLVPEYDNELEAIVLRALAYDPDERYQTAGELEQDLERFLFRRGHPTSATSLAAYMHDLFVEKLAEEAMTSFDSSRMRETSASARLKQGGGGPSRAANAPPADLNEEPTFVENADPQDPTEGDPLVFTGRGAWSIPPSREDPTFSGAQPAEIEESKEKGQLKRVQKQAKKHLPSFRIERRPRPFRLALFATAGVTLVVGFLYSRFFFGSERVASPKPLAHKVQVSERTSRDEAAPKLPATRDAAQQPLSPKEERRTTPEENLRSAMAQGQGLLSVLSPIALSVSAGGHLLGQTPLEDSPLQPGRLRLKMVSRREGYTFRTTLALRAGTRHVLAVPSATGVLDVQAEGPAWVQRGLLPATETPHREELLAGEYEVVVECDDGRGRVEHIIISAHKTTHLVVPCYRTAENIRQ